MEASIWLEKVLVSFYTVSTHTHSPHPFRPNRFWTPYQFPSFLPPKAGESPAAARVEQQLTEAWNDACEKFTFACSGGDVDACMADFDSRNGRCCPHPGTRGGSMPLHAAALDLGARQVAVLKPSVFTAREVAAYEVILTTTPCLTCRLTEGVTQGP